jgi:hypothetical protein
VSYQLAFWRTYRRSQPSMVYAKIAAGKLVRGLEFLDAGEVERRLIAAFPGWTLDASVVSTAGQTALSTEHAAVDVSYTAQAALCTCVGMGGHELNQIIDVMLSMQLPLYDPQTGERF